MRRCLYPQRAHLHRAGARNVIGGCPASAPSQSFHRTQMRINASTPLNTFLSSWRRGLSTTAVSRPQARKGGRALGNRSHKGPCAARSIRPPSQVSAYATQAAQDEEDEDDYYDDEATAEGDSEDYEDEEHLASLPEEGRIVEYIESGQPKLGLLLEKIEEHQSGERAGKTVWLVSSEDSRRFALTQAKLTFVWPRGTAEERQLNLGADAMTARVVRGNAEVLAALAKEATDLQMAVSEDRVRELWESVELVKRNDDYQRRVITPTEAATFLFGRAGPVEVYAAHRVLWNSRIYFKPRGKAFSCRDSETAQDIKQSIQERAESVESWYAFLASLRHKLQQSIASGEQAPPGLLPDLEDLSPEMQTSIKKMEEKVRSGQANEARLLDGVVDVDTEKDFIISLKRYVASVILESPTDEPLDLSEHAQLEGLIKDGAKPVDLFNAMVRLGLFDEKESLDLILHNRPLHFPEEADAWVNDLLARPPPDEDAARRWNLRRLPVYAIDPFDAFEIDDGLSIEADENGDSWVYIHVADPTRWVKPDSPLDLLARERAQALYLPNGVSLPLLPPQFSMHTASLRPNKLNFSLTFAAKIDKDTCEIKETRIAPSLLENVQRLTYGQADLLIAAGQDKFSRSTNNLLPLSLQEELKLLPPMTEREERKNEIKEGLRQLGFSHRIVEKQTEEDKKKALREALKRKLQRIDAKESGKTTELSTIVRNPDAAMGTIWGLHELAKRRRSYREAKGAVIVNLPAAAIRVDDVAQQRGVRIKKLDSAPAAESSGEEHIDDDEEILEGTQESTGARMMVEELMILAGEVAANFAKDRGISVPFRIQKPPKDQVKFKEYITDGREKVAVVKSWKSLAGLPPTTLSATPAPHFSLALNCYTQVTSPLRRYSDILAHHQIKAVLRGEAPPFQAWQFVSMFQTMAQRKYEFSSLAEVIARRWVIQYLKENKDRPFRAVVLDVQQKFAGGNLIGDSRATVLLTELGWRTIVTVPKTVRQGHRLTLHVRTADPLTNYVSFFKVRQ